MRSGKPQSDATVLAANRLAHLLGESLNERQANWAAIALHYGFGAAVGGIYGAAAQLFPRWRNQGGGLALGLLVWALAAEAGLPAVGLAKPPRAYPPLDHLNAALSHIVFGLMTDAVSTGVA